jgi:hypothetical protein
MGSKLARLFATFTVLLVFSSVLPLEAVASRSVTYDLPDHVDGAARYKLNVFVSESLLSYYVGKNHAFTGSGDFASFVTPDALKPIADSLRQIYSDDEDFVNGVLIIVHQMEYVETKPPRYPVETIVEGKGDCDVFSDVAASIILAGGLDCALLYYEKEAHMNIGVNLSHEPQDARRKVEYVMNDGVRYYVAECTGAHWEDGWRVGECPDSVQGASAEVITLEGCEKTAPGQVSASYTSLQASTLSLSVSTVNVIQGSPVTLVGQLVPALQNETVTIYVQAGGSPWTALASVATDSSGRFTYVWNCDASGTCYLRASWSGNNDYSPTDSPAATLVVESFFFVSLLSVAMVALCLGSVVFLASRKSSRDSLEPRPPNVRSLAEKAFT